MKKNNKNQDHKINSSQQQAKDDQLEKNLQKILSKDEFLVEIDKKDQEIKKLTTNLEDLNKEINFLNSEISELKRKLKMYKASHDVVETLRDTQSFLEKKERIWRKKKYAAKSFVSSIIEPLEWFEQSLKNSSIENTSLETKNWLKGFNIILNKFKEIILKEGVEEIRTNVGDLFDENLHNALETVSNNEFKPNTIVEICQKGYKFHDIVIKHVQVKVAK